MTENISYFKKSHTIDGVYKSGGIVQLKGRKLRSRPLSFYKYLKILLYFYHSKS